MTAHKDFKRIVRARMRKTGESYTTARLHLLKKQDAPTSSTASTPIAPAHYATLAGYSDAAVKASTGCNWERWVKALDYKQAHTWSHGEIAAYVHKTYKIPGWWSQMVTVGYERIKGLRAIGQRRDGGFEASKSKVVAAPISRLYRAWRDARLRARWLPDVQPVIRTATRNKSMRVAWPDGTRVDVGFAAKGRTKSQVAIQHGRLPDRAAVTRVKAYWAERLTTLAEVLAQM